MAANLAAHPGHGISQFCGVVSFFEYGRVEEQATMEGKTLLNKS